MIPLKPVEIMVLDYLKSWSAPEGEMCLSFSGISEGTHLPIKNVRLACRAMARKGLTEFYRGLMTEDGAVAGSGYCISAKGSEWMEAYWKNEEEKSKQEQLPI